jgi:glycosyltransferase involved in cell wall biosynthesis
MASEQHRPPEAATGAAPVAWAETPPLRILGQRDQPAADAPSISVFFPAYNDGGTIASMVLEALRTCARLTTDYEVIIGDDASTDYTADVLDDLAAHYPQVRVLHHPRNLGYGGNVRSGFAAATKELVFYTDGDAQYDPRELALLYPNMTPYVDIVQGYKIERNDPLVRIIIGRIYHWMVKILFGLRVRDTDCDFRLIRKSALDRFELRSTSGTICVELVKKLQDTGAHFAEVPVHHYHRVYGRSQFFNFPRIWRTGVQLLALWFELVVQRRHLRKARRPAVQKGP